MDKIIMKNLAFFGYHGVLKEENVLGQKFFLDIELYADLKKAGIGDDVEDTVNYAEAYEKVKDIVEKKRFNLLEALAEDIAMTILDAFSMVDEICVTVSM